MTFACSPCVCMGLLKVNQFPRLSKKYSVNWIGYTKLPIGVNDVFTVPWELDQDKVTMNNE